jgi:hypothetical protein
LDADDILLPEALETHLFFHLTSSPVVAMTCLDSAMIDQDGVLLSGHHREVKPLLWSWLRPSPTQRQTEILGKTVDFSIIPPAANNTIVLGDEYYWTTQSFMMFRRDVLDLILPDQTNLFRVCADYYLVRMVHAFNSTFFIHKIAGAYRLHQSNHFTHQVLTSADQQSGDNLKFNWQPIELNRLAYEIICEKYDQYASIFGEFHVTRALLQLKNNLKPSAFKLMRTRLSYLSTLKFWFIAYTGRILTGVRLRYVRTLRILWEGY